MSSYNGYSIVTNNGNCMYSNVVYNTSSVTSIWSADELLNEFITKLSDDPVYNLSNLIGCCQATWTYDVDSDISYEANIDISSHPPLIRLNIYEGYTLIDSICFERLEATSGYIWEEIDK